MSAVFESEKMGDKTVDRTPDGVARCTTENLLGSWVEQQDDLPFINRDNGVHRRINNSSQSPLAIAKFSLELLTIGDVLSRAPKMSDATAGVAYRFAASANPSFAAIRTYDLHLHLWNQTRRLSFFDHGIQPAHIFRTEEPLDFLDSWYRHFGINSVDTVKLLRPGNFVAGRIPPPVADSCQPLCFCKFFLVSSQSNLSPPTRGHIPE